MAARYMEPLFNAVAITTRSFTPLRSVLDDSRLLLGGYVPSVSDSATMQHSMPRRCTARAVPHGAVGSPVLLICDMRRALKNNAPVIQSKVKSDSDERSEGSHLK